MRVAVLGATGRMGRALVRELAGSGDSELGVALASPASASLGRDAGELAGVLPLAVPIVDSSVASSDELARCDVGIEFVGAAGLLPVLDAARSAGLALVSGSTGLNDEAQHALREAAASIPILHAPNMSLGVAVLRMLVTHAAGLLGDEADIEIFEAHHRFKADSPSGTALALAETAARALGRNPSEVIRTDRVGADVPRVPGEIGIAAVRTGDVIGEHTVIFGLDGERLELTHRASDRRLFVRGALAAARFLRTRPPALYTIEDLLDARTDATEPRG